MAASVTVTRIPKVSTAGRKSEIVQIDWQSAADGSATATVNLHGFLVKAVTDPSATAPTDNYDITLVQYGIDALAGQLADRDTANTEQVYPLSTGAAVPIWLCGDHTFTIAAAGDTKLGTVYLFLVEEL